MKIYVTLAVEVPTEDYNEAVAILNETTFACTDAEENQLGVEVKDYSA